jgi:hypothetical protein
VSVTDGVKSITFTNDENEASSPEETTVILTGMDAAETVANVDPPLVSDAPVATPVLSTVPALSSLLLSCTNHLHVFDTSPLLSVNDMEFCELCPCNNSPYLSVGPEGFNCILCPNGIYKTLLFLRKTGMGGLVEPEYLAWYYVSHIFFIIFLDTSRRKDMHLCVM